jgi:glycosyltransferase involved in cell wall biosynthesis
MKPSKNILVLTPSKVGLTETFIRAHIDGLKGSVFYLYGYNLDFKTKDDYRLSELFETKPSFFSKFKLVLPHFIYFRLEQKRKLLFTKTALIKRFIQENNIDLVFAEYGTSGSFITPICKDLNIPLVVHFHGFDASKYAVLEEFKLGYQKMFSFASTVIAVSYAMKNALMHLGCPESKIVVNPCGPHDNFLNIQPNFNSNSIVAVGRHTYKKAPYLTILAFQQVLKKYPDLKLILIGTGELYEVSKNMVKSLGLKNHIILPGGLPQEHIINYLKESFMFIQHSLVAENGDSEGMPVGIMEAMAAGLPVVSTRHAGIPDVVVEDETGFLVEEGDIDAMAEHILTLVNNRDLAKTFGKNGKAVIQEHFTMEKHLETINNLIYAIE